MKRIILSVFAAAVTAAWVVPASAADVTFSGQYRVRGEYVNNSDFNDADTKKDAGDVWAQRVRLNANLKATDDVSAKVTVQDTRTWGGAGLNTDAPCEGVKVDETVALYDANKDGDILDKSATLKGFTASPCNGVDLHEAYVNVSNIFGTPVSFRAGRQELSYGDERLVGAIGWSNNGQAFDAAKFVFASDAVNVDLFSATVTEGGAQSPTDPAAGDDTYLNGVYATLKQLIPNNTLDAYLFHQTDGATQTRYTLGARLKGAAAGVDYTAEGAYQLGEDSATVDIAAYAFAAKAGYTIPAPLKVRVGAEFDYATGDEASAGENEAFNNLFPTNHANFGIADVAGISWTDILAWSVNASADLNEQTRLYAAYWNFTENEVAAGASDDKGSEIDVVATYKYNNNLTLEAGAAHFMPGKANLATATSPDDARDWAYLQITANF